MSAPFASGARVEVTSSDHVIPKGTRGTVTKVYGSKVGVRWDHGMETDFPTDALAVIAETPEETVARLMAVAESRRAGAASASEEFRRVVDRMGRFGSPIAPPLMWHPPVVGKHPSDAATADDPDDLHGPVSPALRDLVRSQSLAMASADTRLGVATAAWGIACAASGDALLAVVKRSLREVLGGLGDLFDGFDVDGLAKKLLGVLAAPTDADTIVVQVNGRNIGMVTAAVDATETQIIEAIRAEPLLMSKVTGDIVRVQYAPGLLINLTTKAAASFKAGDRVVLTALYLAAYAGQKATVLGFRESDRRYVVKCDDGMEFALDAADLGPENATVPDTLAVGVQVDGRTIGTVTVPVSAIPADVDAAVRADASLASKLPAVVARVEYNPGKVIRFTSAAPAASAE